QKRSELPPEMMKTLEREDPGLAGKVRKNYSKEVGGGMPEELGDQAVQLAVAWGELIGGVALLLGFLTRLAALGLVVIQAVAVYLITYELGFSADAGVGWEYNFAILVMLVSVLLTGGGVLALDRVLLDRPRKT